MAVAIYHNYLMGNASFLYSVSDGFSQFLPIYTDFKNLIQEGSGLPAWNFSVGFGAMQSYVKFFYPTNFLPILAGAIWNEQALAICAAWMQVLKIVAASAFMFMFLKKLKFSNFVCCNMGIIYAFCGILIVRGHWWLLGDECYIAAFILWGAECYFRDKKWHWIPISVTLLASCFGIYYLYLYGLELFIYATVRYIYDKGTLKGYFKYICICGGLYLLGALMAGAILFDYGKSLFGTARYVSTKDYVESGHTLAHTEAGVLMSALFSVFDVNCSGVFHLYTGALNYLERPMFYCGLGCLYFIPQGLIFGEKKTKKLILFGILLACVYMLFPVVTDVFNLFIRNEELGLRSYRMSTLWIVIIIIVAAGYGLQKVQEKGGFNKLGASLTGAFLILTFVYCIKMASRYGITVDVNVCRRVGAFIVAWLVIMIASGWRNRRNILYVGSICGILGLSIFEVGYSARVTVNAGLNYASHYYMQMQADVLGYYGDVANAVSYIRNMDGGFYRIAGVRTGLAPYCSPLYFNIYDSSYYTNIDGKTYEFLDEVYPESFINNLGAKYSIGVGDDLYLSTLTGYKYIIMGKEAGDKIPYGYESFASVGKIDIYRNKFALPIGVTYNFCIRESDFKKYSDYEQRKILLFCLVLEDGEFTKLEEISSDKIKQILNNKTYEVYEKSVGDKLQNEFRVTRWKEDYFCGKVKTSEDTMMAFSIPNVEGWKIYVDGEKQKIVNANIGFMAIALTKGEHLVELKYESGSSRVGIAISMVAVAAYGIMILVSTKRSKRQRAGKIKR